MISYDSLFDISGQASLSPLLESLPKILASAFDPSMHGDLGRWLQTLARLPELEASHIMLDADTPSIGLPGDCSADTRNSIENLLKKLHPWRKGPYLVHGVHIDSEWRSDLKWQRLSRHLKPLQGSTVLDVGCGNGYHCWRMVGSGAGLVIGIDPTLINVIQFHAIKHFTGEYPAHVLPMGIQEMPNKMAVFDTVFSMGVLYHRRSPLDHLLELRELLRTGGQLVLETLVIEGGKGQVLVPDDRYARMRNVWFIPSCLTLEGWLQRCGFRAIRLVDVCQTTHQEQRTTAWMNFESLLDCLNPDDPAVTVEGHPSPRRAIFVANKP